MEEEKYPGVNRPIAGGAISGAGRLMGQSRMEQDIKSWQEAEQKRADLGPETRRQVSQDPWAMRSEGMQCKTCIWYVPKARIGTSNSDVNPLVGVGRCRRHAPTMNGYPVVYMRDWCGDHRLDENKV